MHLSCHKPKVYSIRERISAEELPERARGKKKLNNSDVCRLHSYGKAVATVGMADVAAPRAISQKPGEGIM